ncbi:VOC family protein [Methylobacterium pseudosasicola]|uniref:Catechol 2,3-dioxygenase n=1 Tax=Methylobacterium pseudosasicola TaxID=582667 RepID=A0A1I4QFG8_9HYPH|nr:VOC family protein [Methylobacterium pseudosasicola]SFM38353.1 Catechol 2,3-dioxygenase [Methylobacterium pseudosasicola]
MSGVRAIAGFSRTVADLSVTEAFYRDGLDFECIAPPEPVPDAQAEAMGLAGRQATQLRLRLGDQSVTFLAVEPPGAPYPADPAATDPFFQHLAIPVRDMEAAMARLARFGAASISRGGAQVLPASSGGVTAYKFRDPDGHPLELIVFPAGPPAERWRDAPGLFLGIDHSAITVTDLDASLAFLTGPLGLTVAQTGLNRGPEQARLDGLDDPEVDVIALEPPAPAPHVELLHYRRPVTRLASPAPFGPADRASTCFVFAVGNMDGLLKALREAGFTPRSSANGEAAYCSGPDGHGFLFVNA